MTTCCFTLVSCLDCAPLLESSKFCPQCHTAAPDGQGLKLETIKLYPGEPDVNEDDLYANNTTTTTTTTNSNMYQEQQ
eukprot:UN03722